MDVPTRPSPLAPAALVYAGASVVGLIILPRLAAPLDAYGAPHGGRVLLGPDPLRGLLWGLALGAVLAGTSQLLSGRTPWGRRLARVLRRLVGTLHPGDAVLLAALSALGEEILFRGLLLPYLGLLGSSALFGLAHVVPRHGLWPWSVWAAVAGLGLGGVALATGGILAAIVAHFTVNAVGLLLLAERSR